jgi:hypothetical protein
MKYLTVVTLITAITLSGCGKKEEPTAVADAAPTPTAVEEAAPAEAPVAVEEAPPVIDTVEEVVTTKVEEVVETVKEAMPDMEEVVQAAPEVNELPEMGSSLTEMTTAREEVAVTAAPSADTGMMDQAKDAAMAMASTIDWSNLSWSDISAVPYDDKDKLLAWATPQIDAMKDKLTKAVMDKGVTGLASLGDTGWQGAIKTAVEALETTRTASPETWELARGALMSAWETLQTEAGKYIGEG